MSSSAVRRWTVPGPEAEAAPAVDDLLVERLLAGVAELEPRPAALDVPALVLLPVELEARATRRP